MARPEDVARSAIDKAHAQGLTGEAAVSAARRTLEERAMRTRERHEALLRLSDQAEAEGWQDDPDRWVAEKKKMDAQLRAARKPA